MPDGITVPIKTHVWCLEVLLDPTLFLQVQIVVVARRAHYQIKYVFLDRRELSMVVHVLVTSVLNYCNALYTVLSLKMTWRCQLVKNGAAQLLVGAQGQPWANAIALDPGPWRALYHPT